MFTIVNCKTAIKSLDNYNLVCVFDLVLKILLFFLSNLYTQHEAWAYNPAIKSCMFYWLSQPWTSQIQILLGEKEQNTSMSEF